MDVVQLMWPSRISFNDLVTGGIQDELGPHSVVLRAAVVEERVGQIRHSFTAQVVATAEEHCVLQEKDKKNQKYSISDKNTSIQKIFIHLIQTHMNVFFLLSNVLVRRSKKTTFEKFPLKNALLTQLIK